MTTLITGGAGFIGLAMAECLLRRGEHVVLFDRSAPPASMLQRLMGLAGTPDIVTGDIRSADDVDRALRWPGVSHILHAAAITPNAQREAADPVAVLDVNVGGTACLLQQAARAVQAGALPLRRTVVLSSVAVYGISEPAGERYDEAMDRLVPVALYGISKVASEQTARRLADLYGLDVRVARLGPVYGPWEHATGVRDALSPHAQVLAAALAGRDAVLPRAMRADWVYSRDAAQALTELLLRDDLHEPVYNIGGRTMTDAAQWCGLVEHLAAKPWRWRVAEGGEPATVHYSLPADRAALDIARLVADTGWAPAHDLPAAAADHVQWLRDLPSPKEIDHEAT